MEVVVTLICRRILVISALIGAFPTAAFSAADKPSEIRIDWATYNPVSML